ncbi:MAG: transcriptional repressor LexA [Gemmatimonadota bacterium]
MPDTLSAVEQGVYHYLLDFLTAHTYQPSVREIGKRLRIKSTKTVSELLHSLERKGYIERDPSRSRGVRLLGFAGSNRTQPIPFYGKIAAGDPILLPEHRKGFITVDRRFLPSEDVFWFKIEGESMIGRGIFDGDFVMIQPGTEVEEGMIIAARLGDEATVKTYTHRDGHVVLMPANPAEHEILVNDGDDFAIIGKVCGVFRPFQEVQHHEELELAEV